MHGRPHREIRVVTDRTPGSEGILHEKDSIKSKEITGAKQKKKPVVIVREEAEAIKAVTRAEKANNPGSEPGFPENVSPAESKTVSEQSAVSSISDTEFDRMDGTAKAIINASGTPSIPEGDGFIKSKTKGALPPRHYRNNRQSD